MVIILKYIHSELLCCTSETNIVNKLHLNTKNVLNLRKKKKLERTTILNFRQYYKATVIKTVILAQKQTYTSMNRIGNPEINRDTCSQLI